MVNKDEYIIIIISVKLVTNKYSSCEWALLKRVFRVEVKVLMRPFNL